MNYRIQYKQHSLATWMHASIAFHQVNEHIIPEPQNWWSRCVVYYEDALNFTRISSSPKRPALIELMLPVNTRRSHVAVSKYRNCGASELFANDGPVPEPIALPMEPMLPLPVGDPLLDPLPKSWHYPSEEQHLQERRASTRSSTQRGSATRDCRAPAPRTPAKHPWASSSR